MGCGGSKEVEVEVDVEEEAYRIHRLDDHTRPGHHIRTRRSIEGHLAKAPKPGEIPGRKRRPKEFDNIEEEFSNDRGQLFEYTAVKDYPYRTQNSKGKAIEMGPGGTRREVDPMYTRPITTKKKELDGVGYHPGGNKRAIVRADEVKVPTGKKERVKRKDLKNRK